MSHHARIEELSDSDPDEMDVDDFAPPMAANSIIEPALIPHQAPPPQTQNIPAPARAPNRDIIKHWQCLYPVYFDANRSRDEGRQVNKELAVPNPLAREICDAVHMLGLRLDFEAGKMHPKDWANPGRVRVLLKEHGQPVNKNVHNKRHLFMKVAEYLKAHPTVDTTPMKLRIVGMPMSAQPPPPPAIPRGWKMGNILPMHSPAISGGGVSDNLFKDMMAEMQGQAGGDPGSTAAPKPKKDKKKVKQ